MRFRPRSGYIHGCFKSFKLNCRITSVTHQHALKDKATEENVVQGNEKVGIDPE